MSIKILGIEIENKTDILAFTAFLLSLGSILYQIMGFMKGPKVNLIGPRQIRIITTETEEPYIHIIATLAYTNSGHPGNNSVIMDETLSFNIADNNYIFSWHEFVNSTPSIDGKKLLIRDRSSSHAFVVNAGSSEAHETYFAPRPKDCPSENISCNENQNYLKWKTFVKHYEEMILLESGTGEVEITFKFDTKTLNDGNKISTCKARLTRPYFRKIRNPKIRWVALPCKSEN